MKKQSKIATVLLVISALSLGLLFFTPLWKITLGAPQYPTDLEMTIWINDIKGGNENTLQNINILNHYIGMAPINVDTFPELNYMPWIVVGLMVLGLLAAITRKHVFLAMWVVLLIATASVGLGDFYRWETEFGTNLDTHAPIKLEGMNYSPPFVGEKVLLNIEATSFPAAGGIMLGLAVLLGLTALTIDFIWNGKKSRHADDLVHGRKAVAYAGIFLMIVSQFAFSSCDMKAQPINYGHDGCHYCKMTISDNRYGTELVTSKGKIYKFDSIECLGRFLKSEELKEGDYHSIHVTSYSEPGEFIDAKSAVYLHSKKMPSPMGAYLTAFANKETANKFQEKNEGEILTWDEMLATL